MTTLLSRFNLCAAAAGAAVLLTACGGGGDGGVNDSVAGVTSATAATPKYSQDLILTLQGRNLDKSISATPSGNFFTGFACSTLARSTTAPFVSGTTTAYFRCTNPRLGANTITFVRPSDGVLLASVPFTVPVPQVTLSISNGAGVAGDIVITLEAGRTPITVNNFLAYVATGFYNDTVFHRLIRGFVLQGGGYAKPVDPAGALPTLKPVNARIPLEDNAGLSNLKWTVAMARSGAPDSADSQFFINLVDNLFLDRVSATQRGYAVFGSISAGTDLVIAMSNAPCTTWPAFFQGDDPAACIPNPNLVVTAAVQTR